MSAFIGNSIFEQQSGSANSPVSLIFTNRSLHGVSLIIQASGGSFNDQNYSIYVADDDTNFIKLRDESLGTGTSVDNSFSVENQGVFANPLHFKRIKISVPALGSGISATITISGR